MIVKCEKCQTRFKIPDEKVTDKGVKVRCTKCQNTFRVTKNADGSVTSSPPNAPTSAPPAPPSAAAASRPAAPAESDPFAKFGQPSSVPPLEATRPHLFPEGIAASKELKPLAPLFSAQSDLPAEVFDSPTRVGPVPQRVMEAVTTPHPSMTPPSTPAATSFDPSNPFGAPSAPVARVAVAKVPASMARSIADVPPPPPPPAEAVTMKAASALGRMPAPPSDALTDFGSPDVSNEPTAVKASADLLGDVPAADDPFANASGGGDLFGGANSTLTSQQLPALGADEATATGTEPDRGLFDMPEPPPQDERTATGVPALGDEDSIPTGMRGAPIPKDVSPAASVEKPAGRPEDVGMDEARKPGAVRRTAGLVVNLALATVLVLALVSVGTIYLNEGKLDVSAVSLAPVKALFAAPSDFFAADVSNGLYDTRGSRPVFYVRGDVENRSAHPSRLKVRVEIVDGPTTVAKSEILAGKAPTPEELYSVTSAKELDALTAALGQGATEVKPGERAPFLVAFYEYPPSLTEYRLKVTVEEAAGQTAAR